MDRRSPVETVATNVAAAVRATNNLAQATDNTTQDALDRIAGNEDISVADLVVVGGFLRLHPHTFMRGAA